MSCKSCQYYVRIFKDGIDNICAINPRDLTKVVSDSDYCEAHSQGIPHEDISTLPEVPTVVGTPFSPLLAGPATRL